MTSELPPPEAFDPVAMLRDPATIRERAHRLLELGVAGKLHHFDVRMEKMDDVAAFVAEVVRANYPGLDIPYHGRWRHFATGGYDRWGQLKARIGSDDPAELARTAIDLAVISVLLDAGAGAQWVYHEDATGVAMGRSEGLAVASFYMFSGGLFSSDPRRPLQVDAGGLERLSEQRLAAGFQADAENKLQGLEGRAALARSLAGAMTRHPEIFGQNPARPGNLFDYIAKDRQEVRARDVLAALLLGLSSIWPGRIIMGGQNLGDVWMHSLLTYPDATDQLMPFHKLSQWLIYSLLEPFEWAGRKITGLDDLTGLAEYRNGGLFIDTGLIALKDPHQSAVAHKVSDELVVEWRALTVALLDRLRPAVAEKLDLPLESFPLARLLEGGTWAAGRRLAQEKRAGGEPPVRIISDGTVF